MLKQLVCGKQLVYMVCGAGCNKLSAWPGSNSMAVPNDLCQYYSAALALRQQGLTVFSIICDCCCLRSYDLMAAEKCVYCYLLPPITPLLLLLLWLTKWVIVIVVAKCKPMMCSRLQVAWINQSIVVIAFLKQIGYHVRVVMVATVQHRVVSRPLQPPVSTNHSSQYVTYWPSSTLHWPITVMVCDILT